MHLVPNIISSHHCESKALKTRRTSNNDNEGGTGSKAASKFLSATSRQSSPNGPEPELAADSKKSPSKQVLPTRTNSHDGFESATGSKSPSKKGSHNRTRSHDWFGTESKAAPKAGHIRTRSHDGSQEMLSKAVSKFLTGRSTSSDGYERGVDSKAASKGFHRRSKSQDESEAGKFSKAASKFLNSRPGSSSSLNRNDGADGGTASMSPSKKVSNPLKAGTQFAKQSSKAVGTVAKNASKTMGTTVRKKGSRFRRSKKDSGDEYEEWLREGYEEMATVAEEAPPPNEERPNDEALKTGASRVMESLLSDSITVLGALFLIAAYPTWKHFDLICSNQVPLSVTLAWMLLASQVIPKVGDYRQPSLKVPPDDTVVTDKVEAYVKTESMRFTLTPWERDSVIRLKAACEEENVAYRSIFELAKYVLVVKSSAKDTDPDADSKRLQAALKRMKKKRAWEAKLGLEHADPQALLEEIDAAVPGYFVNHFLTDTEGHRIVAHHHAYAPTSFIYASKENHAKYLKAEQWRMELGAADMEEARCGMAMVSITDGKLTMAKALSYLKMLPKVKANLEEMHSQRIRRIYSQVPSFLSHLVQPAKGLLPSKIAKRITVVPSMTSLMKYIAETGPETESVREWAMKRTLVYNETLEKLKLLDESGQEISPKRGYQQDNRREAVIQYCVEDEVGLGVDNETVFDKSIALIKSRTSDTGSDSDSDKELRDAFAKFDADGSGFIDRKELKRFMRKLGQALSKGELDAVLDAVDTDCDGVISFEEFKAMMIS